MRFKTLVLCSTSAAVLGLASSPARAQQPPVPTDPGVEAQESPADPEAGSPQVDDPVAGEGEQIVVTGFRQSLRSAQNLKRNSEQIVDAIVAEDIGKLPDLGRLGHCRAHPGRAGDPARRRSLDGADPRPARLFDHL